MRIRPVYLLCACIAFPAHATVLVGSEPDETISDGAWIAASSYPSASSRPGETTNRIVRVLMPHGFSDGMASEVASLAVDGLTTPDSSFTSPPANSAGTVFSNAGQGSEPSLLGYRTFLLVAESITDSPPNIPEPLWLATAGLLFLAVGVPPARRRRRSQAGVRTV